MGPRFAPRAASPSISVPLQPCHGRIRRPPISLTGWMCGRRRSAAPRRVRTTPHSVAIFRLRLRSSLRSGHHAGRALPHRFAARQRRDGRSLSRCPLTTPFGVVRGTNIFRAGSYPGCRHFRVLHLDGGQALVWPDLARRLSCDCAPCISEYVL